MILLCEQAGWVTGLIRTGCARVWHKWIGWRGWWHLPYRCHLNKDVPLIAKAFAHHKGWQCWVIFKLFCLAHGKQEWISVLPFWVGSVTLAAVRGPLGSEKSSWSFSEITLVIRGAGSAGRGWLMLFSRTWACVKGLSLQTAETVGNAEIGLFFAMVLCHLSCLPFSVANCHCFFGKVFTSTPSHVSQEKVEPNGVRSVTGLIAHLCWHADQRRCWISSVAFSSLFHTWVLQ